MKINIVPGVNPFLNVKWAMYCNANVTESVSVRKPGSYLQRNIQTASAAAVYWKLKTVLLHTQSNYLCKNHLIWLTLAILLQKKFLR
jgi:hypothetical protein